MTKHKNKSLKANLIHELLSKKLIHGHNDECHILHTSVRIHI